MNDESDAEQVTTTDTNTQGKDENKEYQGSESVQQGTVLFRSLPADWDTAQLGEVATVQGGSTPAKDESEYWDGSILWARPSDLTELQGNTISNTEDKITEAGLESTSTRILPPYSVLLTSRATVAECAVNTVPMATNQGFQSLIPDEELNTWYLYFLITEVSPKIKSLGSGSTFSEISKREVQRLQIPVPPLEEQRKIASTLKNIDLYIKTNQRVVDSSETIRSGLTEHLLRNYSDRTTTHPMIGEYPTEWKLTSLSDVCEVIDTKQVNPDLVDNGIPMIQPRDLREGVISLNEVEKSVSEDYYEQMTESYTPSNEDVFYSRNQNVATASVVDSDSLFCLGRDIVALNPDDVERDFLKLLLNSSLIRNQAERRATGHTSSHLHLDDIRNMKLPIPPSGTQTEILTKLNTFQEYKETSRNLIEDISTAARGLREKLISGELRANDKNIEVSEQVYVND